MKRYIKSTSENGRKDAELLATDGSWELWTPHTFEASIYLARKGADRDHWARWDTAYEGNGSWYFDHFTKKGPLYIFINKADPTDKYQYHAETNSFYDWNDRPADFESFICEHPAFAEFFGIDCDDVEACNKVTAANSISSYNKYADALANHGYSKRKFIKALKEECTEQDLKDLLDNEADLHAYITGFILNSDGRYDYITQEDASKLANEIISEVDNIESCDTVDASDTKYFANMVNAASDLGTYEVFAYYDDSYRGLACNEYANTLSEVDELVNKYANSGYCIRVKNHDSGTILEFTPDNWFNELLPDGGFCALDGLL